MADRFYLQDSRGYVGNDVLWWARDGKGYTTDLSKAHVYTRDQAMAQHRSRPSDIPWPADYIEARTRPAVDMQHINKAEALAGLDIVLVEAPKEKRERPRRHGCGSFISEASFWSGCCPRCGTDNRP
jgi:hypothetical protein